MSRYSNTFQDEFDGDESDIRERADYESSLPPYTDEEADDIQKRYEEIAREAIGSPLVRAQINLLNAVERALGWRS